MRVGNQTQGKHRMSSEYGQGDDGINLSSSGEKRQVSLTVKSETKQMRRSLNNKKKSRRRSNTGKKGGGRLKKDS